MGRRGAPRRRRGVHGREQLWQDRHDLRAQRCGGSRGRAVAYPGGLSARIPGAVPRRRCAARDRHERRTGDVRGRRRTRAAARVPADPRRPLSARRPTSYRGVLRQTASGWTDEEHELNDAREPPGGYIFWDTPKIPDPVNAVLVDPTGAQGWAVGGVVNSEDALLDTSDIDRYPSTGSPRARRASSRNDTQRLRLGRGRRRVRRARHRARRVPTPAVGPEVWLAPRDQADRRNRPRCGAFVYTGPGVTTGQTRRAASVPGALAGRGGTLRERVTPEGERARRVHRTRAERPRRQRRRQPGVLRSRVRRRSGVPSAGVSRRRLREGRPQLRVP